MSRSLNPTTYADLAARTFLFRGIEEETVRDLLAIACVRVEHYEKDQVIFDRQRSERALGIVLYGQCVVTKESDGKSMPMSLLRQTDLFGAAAMFQEQKEYVARVTAQESTWVLLICEEALRDMMRADFRICENYLSYLTARIRYLSSRLDGFLPQSVEERVLALIRQRAEDGVYDSEWSVSALAQSLRVSRSTLYRAMDKLVANGQIERHGRAFRLPEGEHR